MQSVLLVILLILALALIAVVLLQRSEGGGLGIGSTGGVMSARGAATALGKVTWGLGAAFLITALTMTVLSARNTKDASVIDRVGSPAPASAPADTGSTSAPAAPAPGAPDVTDMMPPAQDSAPAAPAAPAPSDAPVTPPRAN